MKWSHVCMDTTTFVRHGLTAYLGTTSVKGQQLTKTISSIQMTPMSMRTHEREFVRTFFTSPTAIQDESDSAKLLRSAIGLNGMQASDVWVPDNEDATAPSMRDEGAENIVEVVAEKGADFPGEIHPRVVWHRDDPARATGDFNTC